MNKCRNGWGGNLCSTSTNILILTMLDPGKTTWHYFWYVLWTVTQSSLVPSAHCALLMLCVVFLDKTLVLHCLYYQAENADWSLVGVNLRLTVVQFRRSIRQLTTTETEENHFKGHWLIELICITMYPMLLVIKIKAK